MIRTAARLALSLLLVLAALPAAALEDYPDERGARSLRGDSWAVPVVEGDEITRGAPVHPSTLADLYREPAYYADRCHVGRSSTVLRPARCTYGPEDATVRVAVLGDSKIGRYFPALLEIAHREGWRMRMYTKSACAFVITGTATSYPECDTYNANLQAHLESDPPDLVITGAQRRGTGAAYVSTWEHLRQLGVQRIVSVWDLPVPVEHPVDCVAQALVTGRDLTQCATEAPEDQSGNPSMQWAADLVDGADFVDLRDWVCPPTQLVPRCAPVVGRVQIYGSGAHMVGAYAETLTDPLHQQLHDLGVTQTAPRVDRVGGSNRYATAAMLSRDVQPGGRVWVASGLDYPDALASAARAGHDASAVLLVRTGSVPSVTRNALLRLAPEEIVVVGGRLAVEDGVLETLRGLSPRVTRIAGSTRYATAAQVATWGSVSPGGRVYLASGLGYADALAAAAQAGADGSPVLLVRPDGLPGATAAALETLAPTEVIAAGGELAVGPEVLEQVRELTGAEVERVAGANRYATAAALAAGTQPGTVLHLSTGTSYADALAAAPAAAAAGGAVLLVRPGSVPSVTTDVVEDVDPARLAIAGGTVAVPSVVEHALFRLLR